MSTEPAKIILQIEGTSDTLTQAPLPGWEESCYRIGGVARGKEAQHPKVEVAADAVLELTLADGTSILVAAADSGRYLAGTVGRSATETTSLRVGPSLRFAGTRRPPAAARDSFGSWAVKSLTVFKEGPAAMTALALAGTFQDAILEGHNGLYRLATDTWQMTKVDSLSKATAPSLLFLHGTGSSTAGSFQGLWGNGYAAQLAELYGGRIYGFEHRSLTESPVANTLALVRTLPEAAVIHLVSHSRGGMIGELLARSGRRDAEPITAGEIERFQAHGKRTGREDYDGDAQLLHDLNRELLARRIQVQRFVRVACPARGTTLASGRLDRWATVMLNLLGKAVGTAVPILRPASTVYNLCKSFLLAVVKERTDARILPGLEAMMPDSPLVALLNEPNVRVEPKLHVIAGDYKGDTFLTWLGDCLTEIFYGSETDLVVNTPSMSGGAERLGGIYEKSFIGREVKHTKYFDQKKSSEAILAALSGSELGFQLLDGPSQVYIARSRGGKDIKKRADAPIVFLLPGIMGSHLQVGHDRIWFDPFSMVGGGIEKLHSSAEGVSPDGWFDHYYEEFARFLSVTHEVRPFVYDWRLSIIDAAELFGAQLDLALSEAEQRGKPLSIVAHSMGGLVARRALAGRWQKFKAIPGSRLLQLGTPNRGSHAIAAVLLGRDDLVQKIERWCDWRHDMKEFLKIVGDFPGVLQMLPWPGEDGLACDGTDYFAESTWKAWHDADGDASKDRFWLPPRQEALSEAKIAVDILRQDSIDPACTVYVAGIGHTPTSVRLIAGELGFDNTWQGDGRAPWSTGIPPQVPVWYVKAVHGDLPCHSKAFPAYLDLLTRGTTSAGEIWRNPPAETVKEPPVFISRSLTSHALYPSVAEVMAAAMGGSNPQLRVSEFTEQPVRVEVVHGSLAWAESPLLIGSYLGEALRGSARFLSGRLEGAMARAQCLGRYPRNPFEAMVFLHPDPKATPAGAIVVGLGQLGELIPGELTQALTSGLLEYARLKEGQAEKKSQPLAVSSLLVGTGFSGLTVEVGMRCLLDALRLANRTLQQCGSPVRFGRITIYEEVLDRAISAVLAVQELLRESQYNKQIDFSGRLDSGHGGYSGRCSAGGGQPGLYRVHIASEKKAFRFTVVTDRARNEVIVEPNQRQVVDGLILAATQNTNDQPGLSRALFELLVPGSMKEAVADLQTLMLSVDFPAAVYPWELMRDRNTSEEDPLVTRIELIRQLASSHGRGRVPVVQDKRVLVVGDTQSGFAKLPGARREAEDVAARFGQEQYEVVAHYEVGAQALLVSLFDDRYRFLHLAGHGAVRGEDSDYTGMVIGPQVYLTADQVKQMRRVPEFVFLNCCHLGSMAADAKSRWGELAVGLATAFIEMGCKAVIAAGWAVDDEAARTFAGIFYDQMFQGKRFGLAVRLARLATFRGHVGTNTWGAFQAYGDERYRFPGKDEDEIATEGYVHASHLLADLELLVARLQCAPKHSLQEFYLKQVGALEEIAHRGSFTSGRIRTKFAEAWVMLGEKERAIHHYLAALDLEDGGMSLHDLEQLANLEVRYGAELCKNSNAQARKTGNTMMTTGKRRIESLLAIAKTAERLSLYGSYWKKLTEVSLGQKTKEESLELIGKMTSAYMDAADYSHNRTGTWDYYPLLNALDGAFLCAALGDRKYFNVYQPQLAGLLAAAVENSRSRLAEERSFFHAVAEVEAARIGALYACFADKGKECIIDLQMQEKLIQDYARVLKTIGSSWEHDSVHKQLQFLVEILAVGDKVTKDVTSGDIRTALQHIDTNII